jgi:hypothetical protein
LSQWRGYTGGVGGYAIGFSWDALDKDSRALHPKSTVMGTTPFAAELRRVEYGTTATTAAADRFVGWMRDSWLQPNLLDTLVERETGLVAVASLAMGELAVVKDKAFEQEQEWRLTALSQKEYPVRVRARPSGLVRYLDIAVNMKTEKATSHPATIAQLVVGPGPDQPSQIAAAQELLKACGHDSNVVIGSKVPFRE